MLRSGKSIYFTRNEKWLRSPKRCGVKVLNIFEVLYIKVLGFGAKILNKPMVCKGVSMNYAPNPGFEFFCLQKGTSTGKCPRISG